MDERVGAPRCERQGLAAAKIVSHITKHRQSIGITWPCHLSYQDGWKTAVSTLALMAACLLDAVQNVQQQQQQQQQPAAAAAAAA